MAVLSRQQLFTESTITAVLAVAAKFTWTNIGRMTRLWAIVLAANLAGTLFAASFLQVHPGAAGASLRRHAASARLWLVGHGLPRDRRRFPYSRHGVVNARRR